MLTVLERAKTSILLKGNFREFFLWRGEFCVFKTGMVALLESNNTLLKQKRLMPKLYCINPTEIPGNSHGDTGIGFRQSQIP